MSSRSRSKPIHGLVLSPATQQRLRTKPIGTHGSMTESSNRDNSVINTLSRSIRNVLTSSRRRGGKKKNTKRKTQKKRKTRKVRRNQK